MKNDGRTRFALKWGDAQSGGLNAIFSGALPDGYAPMRQEGAIVLGVGGDNSHASARSFFEGVMTNAILLGLMAALPFGLLQHNWVLAICFGLLVGFGMAPKHSGVDRD